MGLLSFLFDSTIGLIGSFIGAMNTTELAAMAAVARRWISRLGRVVWPDVLAPHEEEVHGGRNPGE